MSTTENVKVGFVGLGAMGDPMANNLAAAGFTLVVRDASAATAEAFAATHPGTIVATRPADFAGVGLVVTMLPDGSVVQDAMLHWDGGIASALDSGSVVIDMSSARPSDTVQLQAALEGTGVRVIDAPVSGGVPRAVTGELAIMVGGDPDAIEAAQPVLRVLGDPARQFRTGAIGTGHAMKALNNYVGGTAYVMTVEALAVGQRYGLDTGTMIDVINASTGRSFNSEMVLDLHVVTPKYGTGFALGLLAKDVHIAAGIAEEIGLPARMLALSDEMWSEAAAAMEPGADHSMAHQVWFPDQKDLSRAVPSEVNEKAS
jgi:3-hydroxyisobutyrate dehydrogenase